MTKALMVFANGSAMPSGAEINFFGSTTLITSTEPNTQMAASQAATFSNLGFNIISGGSGTNNLRFRNATADGNMLATRSGAGVASDLVNTDSVAAAALFNAAYTDTGTDSTMSWAKVNVEFGSGHGCFHGSASFVGIVYDAASSTRFVALNGAMIVDGAAAEAPAQMKVRAYNNLAAMQVKVGANARTNDSVFRNRINGADGTGLITFGAGVTGLVQDTAVGDAIADGDLVCLSITLLTGVEDLTVNFAGATFTSAGVKSELMAQQPGGMARAASATASYGTPGGNLSTFVAGWTEAQARVPVGFTARASNLRAAVSANTYTGSCTVKLMKNGVAAITLTISAGATGWQENTSDTVDLVSTDEISYEIDEGTANSATFTAIGVTLEDITSAGQPMWKRWGGVQHMGGPRASQGGAVWRETV